MKTYLIHHAPRSPLDDSWAVAFSLPYIATAYARGGEKLWYIQTWLSADQIKRRLAILFSGDDELLIQEVGRDHAAINGAANNGSLTWLDGRLEDEEPVALPPIMGPRAAWAAFQEIVEDLARPLADAMTGPIPQSLSQAVARTFAGSVTGASSRNFRAA